MKQIIIIPTDEEIRKGKALDTNTSVLIQLIINRWPLLEVLRSVPQGHLKGAVKDKIQYWSKEEGLILLTSISRFKKSTLGLEEQSDEEILELIPEAECIKVYTNNNDLFCRVYTGRYKKKIVISLPVQNNEVIEGTVGIIQTVLDGADLHSIAVSAAELVFNSILL